MNVCMYVCMYDVFMNVSGPTVCVCIYVFKYVCTFVQTCLYVC